MSISVWFCKYLHLYPLAMASTEQIKNIMNLGVGEDIIRI
jgi:hypothetical protein